MRIALQGEPKMSYVTDKATCAAMLEALELQLRGLHAQNATKILTMHSTRTQYVRDEAKALPSAATAADEAPFAQMMAPGEASKMFQTKEQGAREQPDINGLDQQNCIAHPSAMAVLAEPSAPPPPPPTAPSDVDTPDQNHTRSPCTDTLQEHSGQGGSAAQEHIVGQPEVPGSERQRSSRRTDSGDPKFEAFIAKVRKQGTGVHQMHHASAHQVCPCFARLLSAACLPAQLAVSAEHGYASSGSCK